MRACPFLSAGGVISRIVSSKAGTSPIGMEETPTSVFGGTGIDLHTAHAGLDLQKVAADVHMRLACAGKRRKQARSSRLAEGAPAAGCVSVQFESSLCTC
eukprot:2926635-Prymnesium_polylepis.1